MRKLNIRLAVALVTFLAGVSSFLLWHMPYRVEEIPALQLKPGIPEGWQKVEVNNRASFYLPPDMKSVMTCGLHSENSGGDILEAHDFGIIYGYGENISCPDLLDFSDKATLQTSNVTIHGQGAMFSSWIKNDYHRIRLCFSDIGDGKTSLNLLVSYRDKRGLDVARQIFNSVEFR